MVPNQEDFDRGRKLGKYEIVTRLSVGGMAELFLAFLPGPGGFKKFLAVKQIVPDARRDETFVKMFLDEARITAALAHPNIGQVFDLGFDPSSKELYLAMEFIAGQNLQALFTRATRQHVEIPVGFSCRVIRDVCLALHYAHTYVEPGATSANPVIHRDVSPKNVMVTYTGDVKVIDFGIAKARGRLAHTRVGMVKGTTGYMSPEQLMDKPLDGRTDLFSAGVMLYELLSMKPLFEDSGPAGLFRVIEEDVKPLAGVAPRVPKALSDVVMRCLARRPDDRFRTARELARAIERAHPLSDEEQLSAFVTSLFDDKHALTQSLLELARGSSTDERVAHTAMRLAAEDGKRATPKSPRETLEEPPPEVPAATSETPAQLAVEEAASTAARSVDDAPEDAKEQVETGEVRRVPERPVRRREPKAERESPWPLRLVIFLVLLVASAAVAVFFFDVSIDEVLRRTQPAPAPVETERQRASDTISRATRVMQEGDWAQAEELLRSCRLGDAPCPGANASLQLLQRERAAATMLDGAEAALAREDLASARSQLQAASGTTLFVERRLALEQRLATWSPPAPPAAPPEPVPAASPAPEPVPATPRKHSRRAVQKLFQEASDAMKGKEYAQARDAAERCVKADPRFADCYRVLGTAQAFLASVTDRNYAPVLESYKRYLELAPPDDPMVPKVRARTREIESMLK